MNDKLTQAINTINDPELTNILSQLEDQHSRAVMPWAQAKILREELSVLAIGYVKLQAAHQARVDEIEDDWKPRFQLWMETARAYMARVDGDKAAKAIEGMTAGDVTKSIVDYEQVIREVCLKPGAGLDELGVALDYLRLQVRTLALAYTKVQSDMTALVIQRETQENFTQSMGSAVDFAAFMQNNFRVDVMSNPKLKYLEVATKVFIRLMEDSGKVPDLAPAAAPALSGEKIL